MTEPATTTTSAGVSSRPLTERRATVVGRCHEFVVVFLATTGDLARSTAGHQPTQATRGSSLNTAEAPETNKPHKTQGLPTTSKEARTYKIKGVQG